MMKFHHSALARDHTSGVSSKVDVEKQRHSTIPALIDARTELRSLTLVELGRRDEEEVVLHVEYIDYHDPLLNVQFCVD